MSLVSLFLFRMDKNGYGLTTLVGPGSHRQAKPPTAKTSDDIALITEALRSAQIFSRRGRGGFGWVHS